MEGENHSSRPLFRFSLRALSASVLAASLASGFFYQELRIHRLTNELSHAKQSRPVLLSHIPGRSTGPRIAGFVGGQFVETTSALDLRTRRNHLSVTANASGLVVNVDGRTIHCKTVNLDQTTGRVQIDEAQFFERIGVDYDISPR